MAVLHTGGNVRIVLIPLRAMMSCPGRSVSVKNGLRRRLWSISESEDCGPEDAGVEGKGKGVDGESSEEEGL